MTTTPTPTVWLDGHARTVAEAVGLPLDRLDQPGDPYYVTPTLRGDYAAVLVETPIVELARTRPATDIDRLHAAEDAHRTIHGTPDNLHRGRGTTVAASYWQTQTAPETLAQWVDHTLAEHRIDVDQWRRHRDVYHRVATRQATRARQADITEQARQRTTCPVTGQPDPTTRRRDGLPWLPLGTLGPSLSDAGCAAAWQAWLATADPDHIAKAAELFDLPTPPDTGTLSDLPAKRRWL